MKKLLLPAQKIPYTAFFLLLIFLILTNSSYSLYYSLNGLNLWFTKMIPALFPFMILSGIMVRLHLTEQFAAILYPILHPLFGAGRNVCYAIIMGFLCGFPMGAKVTGDLLEQDMISETEAEFLLSFCNNIGPVYFCSFVLPLLERKLIWPYVFAMYGIPFLYGIVLRRTKYRCFSISRHLVHKKELAACNGISGMSMLEEIDEAIISAIQSILMLGGYMILFNLFNLIPHVLCNYLRINPIWKDFLAPALEITGGLSMLGAAYPLVSLLLLSFGGLSCIAQTNSIIRKTGLSIRTYVKHKFILTIITGGFYIVWSFLSPTTFLL